MGHDFFDNKWVVEHIRNGNTIWKEEKKNSLTNAGERSILNSYFKNIESPSQFYVRACSGYIGLLDTLATVKGEPVGNGYSPLLVERSIVGFPTIELVDGDYRVASKIVSFSAVGTWSPVDFLFLATSSDNSGILICSLALSTERVLNAGDILQVSFKIRLR